MEADHDNPTAAATADRSAIAAWGMWSLAILLVIGTLSVIVTILPGRARPLFLLPLAFGALSGTAAIVLRRSLEIPASSLAWLAAALLASAGYGHILASGYEEYSRQMTAQDSPAGQAAIALQMLEQTHPDDRDLAAQLRKDLDRNRPTTADFLERRYSAIRLRGASASAAILVEFALVLVGWGSVVVCSTNLIELVTLQPEPEGQFTSSQRTSRFPTPFHSRIPP